MTKCNCVVGDGDGDAVDVDVDVVGVGVDAVGDCYYSDVILLIIMLLCYNWTWF